MTVTPTIDVGQILTLIVFLMMAVSIIITLKVEVKNIKDTLALFARRLDLHEDILRTVVGQVQRVIGQREGRHGPTSTTKTSDG